MPTGFWKKLKKPFFVLAPMADVTDVAFREIIAKHGRPDVFWTEFVSVDGLVSEKGREKLLVDFLYSKKQKPIIAQIFGAKPENFYECAKLIKSLGFDGIDINMGCPDKKVEKQGAGAALMKNPKLAREIIEATKRGAGGLPVSVKTRIGYNKDITEEWIGALLETGLDAITIHARTRKEMSKVPANWDTVRRAVRLAKGTGTLIIGNGDVLDLEDAKKKAKETGVDGVMLGRAIFGNPWLFNKRKKSITVKEKLEALIEHTKLFESKLGKHKNFAIMKKHYKAYVSGFDGAKELRVRLMEADNAKEVEGVVKSFRWV